MDRDIFASIISNLPQFIFWKDINSVYLGCNLKFAKYAGLNTPEEVVGKTDFDLPWSKTQADASRATDRAVIDTRKKKANFEVLLTLKDGSNRLLSMSKSPIFNEDKKVIGIMGSFIDITDFQENKNFDNHQTLYDYGHQIEMFQKSKEATNSKKELFSYAAFHDLKSPTRTIIAFAEILKENKLIQKDPDAIGFLDLIHEAGGKLNNLIQDILTYASVGIEDFQPIEVNIKKLVCGSYSELEDFIASKSAKVKIDVADEHITCHPKMFRLVFYNLIVNGILYNKSTTPTVKFKMESSEDDWVFIVSDNGIGISPGFDEKIFDLFKRISGHQLKGSGLGLSICKKIVELHHGKIWVENNSIGGSVFKFTIPKSIPA